jgi:hypothetical protein
MRYAALVGAVVAISLALAGAASAQTPAFTFNQLPKWSGGEPSIAADPTGSGDVYVVAPQAIPAAVNVVAGLPIFQPSPSDPQNGTQGVAYWISRDSGRTFPEVGLTGSATGGGDSDAEVSLAHTLYVTDLEAIDAALCISHDRGKTFDNCQSGLSADHQGPEDDREWLSRGTKPGELYLTYHDFAAGVPIIEKSTDDGQSFSPCGNILDPNGPAAKTYNPANGTLVSKPVVGPDGSLYVQFSTTDPNGTSDKYNNLYMAVSKGGCNSQFTNYRIFGPNKDANFANIFQWQTIDGAGNLYVIAAGQTGANQGASNVWLFTSRDQGKTWSAPIQVNPPNLKANVLPTGVGGEAGDELSVGFFGSSVSGDPNDAKNQWRYYIATTFSGGQGWLYTTATPDPIHYGQVCTTGTQCGSGNRNLLDFSSATLDPKTGCPLYAIPGDPQNNNPGAKDPKHDSFNAFAYVGYQTGGLCLTPGGGPHPTSTSGGSTGVGGAAANSICGRIEPSSSISRSLARATRTRLRLGGRAAERACRTGAASGSVQGQVARVEVSVSQRQGRRCRFVDAKGGLTKARSCARPVFLRARTRYLRASSQTVWTLTKKVRLPAGTYVVGVRATDRVGHVQRRVGTLRLRVR